MLKGEDYIMGYEEKKEEFEGMIEEVDIRMFLKASPLESGERSKLDRALTKDYYYEELYANSKAADDLVQEIIDKINNEDTHNFILSGYKGCGKSTFIGHFLRVYKSRSLLISFDDHWEPREGIYQNIVMFIYNKIFRDFFPPNNEKPCEVSEKYLDIFNQNENDYFIQSKHDLYDFFTYFNHKLAYVKAEKENGNNDEDVKQKLRDHVKQHILSGSIANIMMLLVFWDIADRIVNNYDEQCCIIFENLDVIHNTKDVPKLVQNIVAFRNNIDKITESLYYQGKMVSNPSQDYILFFVMRETTKAEFTNSINHFSDKKIRFQHIMNMSDVYDIYGILDKRYKYLLKFKQRYSDRPKFQTMLKNIENTKCILEDSSLKNRLYSVFNNDYRTCIEALSKIGLSDKKITSTYMSLRQIDNDENWVTYGCRSIVYRRFLNAFVNDIFFKMIRKYEYSVSNDGKIRSVNLDRMILLYLNNSQNILANEKYREKEYISIKALYSEVLKFCKKPDTIVEAIWNMYDLQNTEMWNHLVTFDDVSDITYDELQNEMEAVKNNKDQVHYAKIRITRAGEVYLNHILPHFEYYAARSMKGVGYSLFCNTAEELCDIRAIVDIIKAERKELSACCKKLFLFFKEVFDNIDDFKGVKFLDTNFATVKVSQTTDSISRMYHCERVIHSNIGYLDSFRFYVFFRLDEIVLKGGFNQDINILPFIQRLRIVNKEKCSILPKEVFNVSSECILTCQDDNHYIKYFVGEKEKRILIDLQDIIEIMKICYNKSLVDMIIEYMKLFGFHNGVQSTIYSEGTKHICEAFDACIDHKIIKSGYLDFTTKINTQTGEAIISEFNKEQRQSNHKHRIDLKNKPVR